VVSTGVATPESFGFDGSRRSPVAAARTSIPQTAVTRSSAGVGVWLPSYIERLALAPLEVGCGDDASAGWRTIVVAAVIQGQVGLETSNNIIEKGLALRPRQSGSVVASTGY